MATFIIAVEDIHLACQYIVKIERVFTCATLHGKKGYSEKLPNNLACLISSHVA